MAIKRICCCVLLYYTLSVANLQEPFPQGFSMGNMGTILWEDGVQGRQPWVPAAYCDNTRRFGLACGAVSYYDKMDNFGEESMFRAFGGVWYALRKFRCKVAISHFSALGMYYEQSGFLSLGVDLLSDMRISAEINGTRIGLAGMENETHSIGEGGFSAWIPFRFAAVAFSLSHIVLKSGYTEGVDPPFIIKTGIHTVRNRFGAQGVLIEVTPSIKHPLRFILGEQYRFCRLFAIEASLASNPFLIGIGVSVEIAAVNAAVSLVNHSVLGWSKGFAVMY